MKSVPRLVVTRFEPHAQELADKLNQNNIYSIAQPLLTVVPLIDSVTLNAFLNADYDVVIAVSGNAVFYTQLQINGLWPKAKYYAVGQSTQRLLNEAAQQQVESPLTRFDSEGLLALDSLQSMQDKQVLILRGEGGRDLLETTLIRDR